MRKNYIQTRKQSACTILKHIFLLSKTVAKTRNLKYINGVLNDMVVLSVVLNN